MRKLILIAAIAALPLCAQVQNLEQVMPGTAITSAQWNRITASLNTAIGLKVTDPSSAAGDIIIRGASGWLRIAHPGAPGIGGPSYLCTTGATTAGWCASPIPKTTAVLKGNDAGGASAATAANVVSLWSGTPSPGLFLGADGILAAPSVGGVAWGAISGPIANQTDLATVLAGKQATITTGTIGQYLRGDLSLAPFPSSMTPTPHAASHAAGQSDPITPASIGAAASNAAITVNSTSCTLGSSCTVSDTTKVPTTRQVNGHPLTADVNVTKTDVGLGSVDNTSDAAKPISTATQTALNAKVDKGAPLDIGDGSTAGRIDLYPPSDATHYVGFAAPASRATALQMELPTADPTAGQQLQWSAPSGGKSTATWVTPGGGGPAYWSKTIVFGAQNSAVATTDATTEGPRVPVTYASGVTLKSCTIGATTGPVGAALTINVLDNGVQAATCVIADGQTTGSSTPNVTFAASHHITFTVASVTWTTAPRGVSAELLFQVN